MNGLERDRERLLRAEAFREEFAAESMPRTHRETWEAFAASGKIEDYLRFVREDPERNEID